MVEIVFWLEVIFSLKGFLKAHPHRILTWIKCRRGASRIEGDFVIERGLRNIFPEFVFFLLQIEHFGVFYD